SWQPLLVDGCVEGSSGKSWRSGLRQHLAKLLCRRRHDGDEIGLAQTSLHAVALEVAARPTVEHRGMRGPDAGVACAQSKRNDLAPIGVVRIEGIARQRHGLALQL